MKLPLTMSKRYRFFWILLFALISGSYITGMTGYVTMGMNYPFVLLLAVGINFLLATFISNLASTEDSSFFLRLMNLFNGRTGHFFASFAGIIILIILLCVTTGESKIAAESLRRLLNSNLDIAYFIGAICIIALIPSLFGSRISISAGFSLVGLLIVMHVSFFAYILISAGELPEWSVSNMYNTPALSDFTGVSGIVYIAIRLAFWSIIALELLNAWSKTGRKSLKLKGLVLVSLSTLIFTTIPGLYIAGLFPAELWQLIVMGEDGCNGACVSIALGIHFGGITGGWIMGLGSIMSHVMLIAICFLLITRVIANLASKKLFFGKMADQTAPLRHERNSDYALFVAFCLSLFMSTLNVSASYWVGLGLYLSFGLIMCVQLICLINARYNWFESNVFTTRTMCVLTVLSVLMIGILFYTGFRGDHELFLNYAFAIFVFSLWVAASSLVYLIKFGKEDT